MRLEERQGSTYHSKKQHPKEQAEQLHRKEATQQQQMPDTSRTQKLRSGIEGLAT